VSSDPLSGAHAKEPLRGLRVLRLPQHRVDDNCALQARLQGQMHALRGQRIHAETGIPKPDVAIADGILGVLAGSITCL
jgi:hypothetical protein